MFEEEKEATVATVREVAEVNLDRQGSHYIDIVEVYSYSMCDVRHWRVLSGSDIIQFAFYFILFFFNLHFKSSFASLVENRL